MTLKVRKFIARGAALDAIGIDLFDDAIGNHCRSGADAKREQGDPSGRESRQKSELQDAYQHYRGAERERRFAPAPMVGEPAE